MQATFPGGALESGGDSETSGQCRLAGAIKSDGAVSTDVAAKPVVDPGVAAPCLAWSQDWLRQIYGQCASRADCRNEFGFAWRYLVPETKRHEKTAGVCLCRRYTDQKR